MMTRKSAVKAVRRLDALVVQQNLREVIQATDHAEVEHAAQPKFSPPDVALPNPARRCQDTKDLSARADDRLTEIAESSDLKNSALGRC
jgi:hypothetical protein